MCYASESLIVSWSIIRFEIYLHRPSNVFEVLVVFAFMSCSLIFLDIYKLSIVTAIKIYNIVCHNLSCMKYDWYLDLKKARYFMSLFSQHSSANLCVDWSDNCKSLLSIADRKACHQHINVLQPRYEYMVRQPIGLWNIATNCPSCKQLSYIISSVIPNV